MISRVSHAIWPRAESENSLNPPEVFATYAYYEGMAKLSETINSDVRSKLEEFSKTVFEEEEKRRERIEEKASRCLSSTGILSTLTIGFSSLVAQGKLPHLDLLVGFAASCLFLALLYILRAAIEALKVFGNVPRYCLGPDDLIPSDVDTESMYGIAITKKLLRYTIENYRINNRQLAIVWTAQICMRNGVVLLTIGGIGLAIRVLLASHTT